MKDFEILSHMADIKIRVYGKTLEQFFKNAVIGMFQSIGPLVSGCSFINKRIVCAQLPEMHAISMNASNLDSLLVDFLSEVLYLSDVHNEAYLDAAIHEVNETQIRATVKGVKVEGFRVVEVKAVTYHELTVENIDGIWQSNIVFDI